MLSKLRTSILYSFPYPSYSPTILQFFTKIGLENEDKLLVQHRIPTGNAPSISIGGVEEDYTRGSVVTAFAALTDGNGNPVNASSYCNITITHWDGSSLIYDARDDSMVYIHQGFYYYTFNISSSADYGSYAILVEADPSGIDTHAVSGFHVIWTAVCGDSSCDRGETCENCPTDCGSCPTSFNGSVCGDGNCNLGETCENCEVDCGSCPTGAKMPTAQLELIGERIGQVENKTEEVREMTERIWNIFKRTDQSVINNEVVTSNRLSRETSIGINYSINIPVKEGFNEGDYLPLRWKFWFLDAQGKCIDQEKGMAEPLCTPLIAETIGRANDSMDVGIRLRPSLRKGNYSLVREFEVDPEQVWVSYGREVIGLVQVLEDNMKAEVELRRVEKTGTVKEKETVKEIPEVTGMVVKMESGNKENDVISFVTGFIVIFLLIGSAIMFIVFIMFGGRKRERKQRRESLWSKRRSSGEKWYEK